MGNPTYSETESKVKGEGLSFPPLKEKEKKTRKGKGR